MPSVGEFAHLHPSYDGSLHLALPADLAADLVTRGWGRMHPWAGTRLSPGFVMVYGPRDDAELDTVQSIVAASHAYATGELLCVMSRDVVQPADARAADNEWFRW